VVGVGSVGTRCAVALYVSAGAEPLVLQVKEACPSVLARYAGKSAMAHEGERVGAFLDGWFSEGTQGRIRATVAALQSKN